MRTFALDNSPTSLSDAIERHSRPDYVYSYPPRQAYRPMTAEDLEVGSPARCRVRVR